MSSFLNKKLDICERSCDDISMKITEYIMDTIGRLPKGYVFTYADFMGEVKSREAVIKALNRMAASGRIAKLSKGRYYKPEKSPFGELEPDQYQVVKDILEEDGKIKGYLTGYSIFPRLGLTSQVGNIIQIGKNAPSPAFMRGRYKIAFVLQKNTITEKNIPLLQKLDAVRFIKNIPDTPVNTACKRLIAIFGELPENEKSRVVKLSMKYPPSTRALLGAIFETSGDSVHIENLKNSLNPITKYNFPGIGKALPNATNWNIVS